MGCNKTIGTVDKAISPLYGVYDSSKVDADFLHFILNPSNGLKVLDIQKGARNILHNIGRFLEYNSPHPIIDEQKL